MNCKPGDLAIVVKSDVPEALGCICSVLKAARDYPSEWECEFQRKIKGANFGLIANVHRVPDAWLRPVSGLPVSEDTTTDTPIKELA